MQAAYYATTAAQVQPQSYYAAPMASPQLPPGWQLAYTHDGQAYYVDHNTRTTHWTPPVMPAMPPPPAPMPAHYPTSVMAAAYAQPQIHAMGRGAVFQRGGGGGGFQRGGGGGGRGAAGGVGRGGIDHTKRKTKMCMNWESGQCTWGDRCAFAHGPSELCSANPHAEEAGHPAAGGGPRQPSPAHTAPGALDAPSPA